MMRADVDRVAKRRGGHVSKHEEGAWCGELHVSGMKTRQSLFGAGAGDQRCLMKAVKRRNTKRKCSRKRNIVLCKIINK
jgi:hypothetical protein